MTTTVVERQYPLVAAVKLGIANIGAGNGYDIKIPAGAFVRSVILFTSIAFDGTTNTGTISDGTTSFVTAQDVKTTGAETVAVANKYYPTGGVISVTLAQTGTAPVGEAIAMIDYVVPGRWSENQT